MKRVISWAGFGLLFLAVTVFCLSPHSRSPVEVVDKASLFVAFATLAFIATLLIQERWSVWLILAAAAAWGGAIALTHLLPDGQKEHWLTAIADAVGAGAGVRSEERRGGKAWFSTGRSR